MSFLVLSNKGRTYRKQLRPFGKIIPVNVTSENWKEFVAEHPDSLVIVGDSNDLIVPLLEATFPDMSFLLHHPDIVTVGLNPMSYHGPYDFIQPIDAGEPGWLDFLYLIDPRTPILITDDAKEIFPILMHTFPKREITIYRPKSVGQLPHVLEENVLTYLSPLDTFNYLNSLPADDRNYFIKNVSFWKRKAQVDFGVNLVLGQMENPEDAYIRLATDRGLVFPGSEKYITLGKALGRSLELDDPGLIDYFLDRGAVIVHRGYNIPAGSVVSVKDPNVFNLIGPFKPNFLIQLLSSGQFQMKHDVFQSLIALARENDLENLKRIIQATGTLFEDQETFLRNVLKDVTAVASDPKMVEYFTDLGIEITPEILLIGIANPNLRNYFLSFPREILYQAYRTAQKRKFPTTVLNSIRNELSRR